MKQAIALSKEDNVATLLDQVVKGDEVVLRGADVSSTIIAEEQIPAGHKVAINEIPSGGVIIKYANRIGVATKTIHPGEYVHVHNVVSVRTEVDRKKGGECV